MLQTKVEGNGVWLYFGAGNEPALVAWWYGGLLQNLALVSLTEGEKREEHFVTQLQQMAWAGELEGWLNETPSVHVIADPAEAAIWEPMMRVWVGNSFKISPPADFKELSARSAERAARESARSNLLPPEAAKRYRQQFIDGLWMRGIVALFAAYAFAVIVYLTVLFVMKSKNEDLRQYVRGISVTYTNALINKNRLQIIKERQELKYAALVFWAG